MARRKGFFENLFDISFNEFIAPKIVGILYLVILVIMGFAALAIIFAGFSRGAGPGLGAVIFAPLVFLAYLIFIRIGLEGFIATIKTAENTRIIAESARRSGYQ